MFVLLLLWLALLLLFSLLALLKKKRFRGYAIPARTSYALLLVNEIWVAMAMRNPFSLVMIATLVITLGLIGLLETGFRNKLQNELSSQLLLVISAGFVLTLGVLLLVCFGNLA